MSPLPFRWVGPGVLQEDKPNGPVRHGPGKLLSDHSFEDSHVWKFIDAGSAHFFKISADGTPVKVVRDRETGKVISSEAAPAVDQVDPATVRAGEEIANSVADEATNLANLDEAGKSRASKDEEAAKVDDGKPVDGKPGENGGIQ